MLILISDAFDKALPEQLKKFGDVTDDHSRQSEAEVILIRSKTKVTKEYIDNAPNLKLVIRGGVGLDNVDLVYAKEKGIQVHNTADASVNAVAELAFAMMIAMPNNIVRADTTMKAGEWAKKELKRTELHGKTLGILGMGRIGTALAMRAKAFGMRVICWHPDVYFSDFAEIYSSMDDLLKESDFVSLHMPLLDSTRGIINKDKFALCKDGTYFINTGRGACVNENDVVTALDSGKLAGYATDVWASDPPKDTPLTSHPKTLLAPHIGASTVENMIRIGQVVNVIINDYINAK